MSPPMTVDNSTVSSACERGGDNGIGSQSASADANAGSRPTVSTKFGGARPPRLPSSLPLALWSGEDGDNRVFSQWIWAEMCVSLSLLLY
jgi:hypothetical protein